MTTINKREDILPHENTDYIATLEDWHIGKIPNLCDYRKLSVDDMEEAKLLAKIGYVMLTKAIPQFEGKPTQLYFTQALVAGAALLTRPMAEKYGLNFEKYRSVLLVCPSRWGKSFINAACLIALAGGMGLECQIGAGLMAKAEIIQSKVVELLPNADERILDGLVFGEGEKEDKFKKIKRLTTQVSKASLKWTNGGSIGMFSTNESQKNSQVAAGGAIGIGGQFAVFDEIQMMTPVGFYTASRFMVEHPDTKRFCVGNPMINGHFKELYDDPDTFVVHINEIEAIIEGRFTREGVRRTSMPTYSAEYRAFIETEFPDERSGTRFFTTLPAPYDPDKMPTPEKKQYFMGVDSAYTGGDALMVTLLSLNTAGEKTWCVVEKQINLKDQFPEWGDNTTYEVALEILKLWEQYNVVFGCLDIGFGIHIWEAIRRLIPDIPLEPIDYTHRPTEWRCDTDFNAMHARNKRAELHLDLRDLSSNDLIYINKECYTELIRQMSEIGQCPAKEKIQIESKKEIKNRLGRSPDHLDSACLAIHAMVLSGVFGGAPEEPLMETY